MKAGLIGLALAALLSGTALADDGMILHGGPIYTGAGERTVEALAIRDGKVVFSGPLAGARKAAPQGRDIDLDGAAAYPGFVDAHVHLDGVGLRAMTLNLEGSASLAEMLAKVKAYAAAHPGGPIIGGGWIETHWPEKRFPSRADLDAVAPDRPVFLFRADGHAAVVNTVALNLAGITPSTKDPSGGRIEREAKGAPSGMLIDHATALVEDRLPAPTATQLAEAMDRAVRLYASRGWTGAHYMSASAASVSVLDDLAAAGKLPIRVDAFMTPQDAGAVLDKGPFADPTGLVRVRGVKLYMDGALGSRGAALLKPYADDPTNSGLLLTDEASTMPVLERAKASGAQVAMHAIGDRGNRLVLDWFEKALAGRTDARWRIEHAQILDAADLPRFAKLGVTASMQPSHAIGDLYFAPARLGDARLDGAYAWKSLLDSGAVIAAGSDAPVEQGDPRIEFYAAVTRKDLKGNSGVNWRPEQAVTRAQALKMLTSAPAYAVFHENDLGRLSAGWQADVTVFSKDLMTVQPADILTAKPLLTIVAGRIVFDGR